MMSDIKKAVFVPCNGHLQIDADLHAKAEANYCRDLERERDELRAEIEQMSRVLNRLHAKGGIVAYSEGEWLVIGGEDDS
jgi:hypothetical protein